MESLADHCFADVPVVPVGVLRSGGFVSVPRPTPDDVRRIATAYHFSLSDYEVTTYGALVDATLESYDRLDELVEPIPPVRYPRERGQRAPATRWVRGTTGRRSAARTME